MSVQQPTSTAFYTIQCHHQNPFDGSEVYFGYQTFPFLSGSGGGGLEGGDFFSTDRVLMKFDTSFVGAASVSKVEFYQKLTESPANATNYQIDYHLGGAFTPDAAGYLGGTLVKTQSGIASAITNGDYVDLGPSACALINRTGFTTLRLSNPHNDNYGVDPDGNGTIIFDAVGGFASVDPCKLRVTYQDGASKKRWLVKVSS